MLNAALAREIERELRLISGSTGYGEIAIVVERGCAHLIRRTLSRKLPRAARSGIPPPSRAAVDE